MTILTASIVLLLAAQAEPEGINDWIRDLAAEDIGIREESQERLLRLGSAAVPALRRAAADPNAERAERARRLLSRIERRPAPEPVRFFKPWMPWLTAALRDWIEARLRWLESWSFLRLLPGRLAREASRGGV